MVPYPEQLSQYFGSEVELNCESTGDVNGGNTRKDAWGVASRLTVLVLRKQRRRT